MNSSLFVAAARPTLSVDRQLGHSFKTPKVPRDCLKVGRDELETDFQAVAWRFGRRESPSCRGRRLASRSRSRGKHTIGQLLHTMHSPPCHNLVSSCHAHSLPFSMMDYVSVSLFYISVSSAYILHILWPNLLAHTSFNI